MRKGFMMIELCLVMIGIMILINTLIQVLTIINFNTPPYDFAEINTSCDLLCALKKLTP